MVPDQSSVLDVGSGGCHLLDALKARNVHLKEYLGIDIDDRILSLAREKHPDVNLMKMDFHDLNLGRRFDTVVACGLYSGEPERIQGISRLMEHTEHTLILTYFAKEKFAVPLVLKSPAWTPEFILHDIDPRLEILRLWRL